MLNPKEATAIAAESFDDFYSNDPFEDIRLEEVERVEEDGHVFWLITLGYIDKSTATTRGAVNSLVPNAARDYKRFKIDAETGDVISMRIRSPENA